MTAQSIDGKTIAANLRRKISDAVHRMARDSGVTPGLAVVLVGENPASEVYVRNKAKAVTEAGMRSFDHKLSASTSEAQLLDLVGTLNADRHVNGILVQLPLPPQINTQKVIAAMMGGTSAFEARYHLFHAPNPLRERLLQLVAQSVLVENVLRISAGQELVLRRDLHQGLSLGFWESLVLAGFR